MSKQLGIRELRQHIRALSEKEREDLICHLYKKSNEASLLLEQLFLGPKANETIVREFDQKLEKMYRRIRSFEFKNAKKLFRETKKVVTDVTLLAEINLSFAYYATVFTYDYGDMYEDFYDTTAKAFIAAMNEAERNPDFARKHQKRFRDIYEMANWMAWGFGEVVVEEFARVDWDNI